MLLVLVHYSILFHSRGGYFNSLILQALELLPGRAELDVYVLSLCPLENGMNVTNIYMYINLLSKEVYFH